MSLAGRHVVPKDAVGADRLTPQETRVARGVVQGRTNREIAADLFLSVKTVEMHLSRVYRKVGARSRTDLVRVCNEEGLLG